MRPAFRRVARPSVARPALALTLGLAALSPTVRASDAPTLHSPPARTAAPAPSVAGNPRRTPVVEVVERVRGAVVNIHSERTVASNSDDVFHQGPNRVNGMGTGIIIDPRGYIITNHHVVDDVQVLRVALADGTTYPAKVVARDPETDLALMKVEPRSPLPTLPLGTAGDLMIGESVIAIGNAFGYQHTVTTGVVSATKRDVTLNKDIAYKQLIQTDASINPGNSGGPLLNIQGELIGVNVAIRAGAQGIGFAIPVDQMIRVGADMISGRKKYQALHSVVLRDQVEPNTSPVVRSVAVEQTEVVTQASASGLLRGDVIVKVEDQRVTNSLEFERTLIGHKPGEKVAVTVMRDGAEKAVEFTLTGQERSASAGETIWRRLGMKLQPTTTDTVARVNGQLQGGLSVVEVNAEGPAGRSGIQRGDILIGLHQWETLSIDNVLYVINHPDAGSFAPIKFFVIRNGQVRRGTLQ